MYVHCDLNKFYASIIRVFMPELEGKPIIVLSNNDGCNICYSPGDLKVDLGIKMGTPIFEIEHLVKKYDIHVFSCNFPLIADMSIRVKSMLERFCPSYENYSIDEIFMDFTGFTTEKVESIARELVRIIGVGLGLPISIGIGTSKTLAKVATWYAKRYKGYKGVCVIDTEEKREKALKLFDIRDVWGIGKRYEYKLRKFRVKTAYDFTQMSARLVRKEMTVVGERTYRELWGQPCFELEVVEKNKKNIMVSRSFGKLIPDFETIAEALSTYACMAAAKLRKQSSKAKQLCIFLETSPFRKDLDWLSKSIIIKLPVPTSSSVEIIKYAKEALRAIYEEGYMFKITGIMVQDLCPDSFVQLNLYDPLTTEVRRKHDSIMKTTDRVNNQFGRNTLYIAAQGDGKKWWIKQEKLPPYWSTRLSDIPVAM